MAKENLISERERRGEEREREGGKKGRRKGRREKRRQFLMAKTKREREA